MTANYVLLEKITVGAAGAASVTFSGIPQTGYTDLLVKASLRTDQTNVIRSFKIQPNGTDITAMRLGTEGNPQTPYSDATITVYLAGSTATASTFGNSETYIPNYASTTTYKSLSIDAVTENNGTNAGLLMQAGLYSSNTAISSITLLPSLGNFVQHSTFYLYGVAKLGTTPVIVPYATGGDTIMTDGTFWYHAFRSSGTFTPAKNLSCDVLVVAGGGGGGSRSGGGGGAGGISYLASQLVSTSAQTITVGAGGTAGSRSVSGTNGSDSQFASLAAGTGGGRGSSAVASPNGAAGGSGGGAGNNGTGGSGVSGQGFAGGNSNTTSFDAAGGGGAGAVGANASTVSIGSGAGAGGTGVNTYSTWLNPTGTGVGGFIAGGGGGGSFGSGNHGAGSAGGGGAGADTAPVAGTANTGGGGGGAGNSANTDVTPIGANGGSGLVIVRYEV